MAKRAAAGGPEFTWLFFVVATVVFAPLALVAAIVARPAWGWPQTIAVGATGFLHLAYYVVLQRGYRTGDLSLVYPIARGSGPLLSVAAGAVVFGESLSAGVVAGAAVVVVGVVILVNPFGSTHHAVAASLRYGLLTGLIIGGYTIWDTRAVARLGIPPLLLDWCGNAVRSLLLAPIALRDRVRLRETWRRHRREAIGIGILSSSAYILVLTALTLSPVSRVAPAREVSIIVGAWLGGRVLGEGDDRRRIAASVVVVTGVLLLAFS